MNDNAKALFELLPAVHRVRDAELAKNLGLARGPLEELMLVFAEQIAVVEENLEQLEDDLFIETCADWVVPYIGDLIGYRALHQQVAEVASPRAEVAHTIALRRRKGTALVLEQVARDVTAWDARAVEYFQRLATTQHMNHPRLHNLRCPNLRQGDALEWFDTPFDTTTRTVEVRHIQSGRGRFNIPNVGLHLWRIRSYHHRDSPAFRDGPRRYRASPLNHDLPLYNSPVAEVDITHLAEPDNIPWPLSRRRLARDLSRHYGTRASAGAPLDNPQPSLELSVDGVVIERDQICVCNLSDDGGSWAHTPPPDGFFAIDPVLGRVALPADAPDPADVRLTFCSGFSADLGGGEYERGDSLPSVPSTTTLVRVPDDKPTLAEALTELGGAGVIEITDSSRYAETLAISVQDDSSIELRALNGRRPVLELGGFTVEGGRNSACILNGLLLTGAPLSVPQTADNQLERLELQHCTLVPGLSLDPAGNPTQPDAPSLLLGIAGLETVVRRSILGGVRSHERAKLSIVESIVDATRRDGVALAALDDQGPGALLSLDGVTLVGKVHAAEVGVISNSILFAALAPGDTWSVPVRVTRKQQGCVRFSWLPFESIVPRRFRCEPKSAGDASRIAPGFVSLRYGTPPYAQLTTTTPPQILRGADDESEMGVFHHLYGAQRLANLRIRLDEYLRVGLLAGIFQES